VCVRQRVYNRVCGHKICVRAGVHCVCVDNESEQTIERARARSRAAAVLSRSRSLLLFSLALAQQRPRVEQAHFLEEQRVRAVPGLLVERHAATIQLPSGLGFRV
jgi:hypothetical protein